jgi:hypothetical protein
MSETYARVDATCQAVALFAAVGVALRMRSALRVRRYLRTLLRPWRLATGVAGIAFFYARGSLCGRPDVGSYAGVAHGRAHVSQRSVEPRNALEVCAT